jgi:thiamine-phosphate pyrophosphorylase
MIESLSAGADRALRRAQARAIRRGGAAVEPADLLAALVDEAESRATEWLAEADVTAERLWDALGTSALDTTEEALDEQPESRLPESSALRACLQDAVLRARALDRSRPVGTEHLLAGLLFAESPSMRPLVERLAADGIDLRAIANQLTFDDLDTSPLPFPPDIAPLDLGEPASAIDLGRILDASANRAREGLRVVEDYVRFTLDDPGLTRRLKDVRHRLAEALRGLDPDLLIGARDTPGDVGTHIMTATERIRESSRAVLSANFKRTQEALRSLEEYAKLVDEWVSGRFEVLRYDVYTLEKLTMTAAASVRALGDARLMVLVGGLPTLGDLTWIVGEALAGGADVIQLREKHLPDRLWLSRAREVRILTAQARARFVVNDRADLARLAGADGVHLGQDEITVRDARRIVGPTALVGVSTHDRVQLEQAVLAGASYLGVGPVFPSATKDFGEFAGPAFVRSAGETTTLPWFAIGGINESTLDSVLESGARRVAVSAAVVKAASPRKAAAAIKNRLDAEWGSG